MANRQVTYTIRLNAEGKPEVMALHQEVTATGQAADATGESLKRFEADQIDLTGPIQKTTQSLSSQKGQQIDLSKASRTSNDALLRFSQAARIAPSGVNDLSNALIGAKTQFSEIREQTGSSTQAFKTMVSSMIGPQGIMITLSLLTSVLVIAGPKIYEFFSNVRKGSDEATKSLDEFNDMLQSSLSSNLDTFFSQFDDIDNKGDVIAKIIDELTGMDKVQDAIEKSTWSLDEMVDIYVEAEKQATGFNTAQSTIDRTLSKVSPKILEMAQEQTELTDKVIEELENRLAIARANEIIEAQLEKMGLLLTDQEESAQRVADEAAKRARERTNEVFEMEMAFKRVQAVSDDIDMGTDMDPGKEERELQQAALMQFPAMLREERIRNAELTGDRLGSLEMQRQQEMKALLDLEIADWEKAEQLKTEINERYSHLRRQIEEDEAAAKMQNIEMAVQGGLQVMAAAFEGNKKISRAIAIADGLAASISALKAPPGPPWTITMSAGILATSISRANKIGSLDVNSASGSGMARSNPMAAMSGIQHTEPQQNNQQNFPNTLRLEDRSGKFLTTMQLDQEKSPNSGSKYMSSK